MDRMAQAKGVPPVVLSVEAPLARRKETASSAACQAAHISGVLPFLVFGCKDTRIRIVFHIDDDDDDDDVKNAISDGCRTMVL